MPGVIGWFQRRGGIPLAPPPSVREYGSLGDDPDRNGGYSTAGIRGVSFVIEYFDSRGWTSIRTIRCLGIDPLHPASITAYCHVREEVCDFRLDRIISIMDLRSGRIVSAEEHLALLAPYLPNDAPEPEPELSALIDLQDAVRGRSVSRCSRSGCAAVASATKRATIVLDSCEGGSGSPQL